MQKVSPKTILYLVLLAGSLAFLAYALRNRATPVPSETRKRPTMTVQGGTRTPWGTTAEPAESAAPVRLIPAVEGEADFGRYRDVLTRNIFATAPSAGKAGGKPPKPEFPKPYVQKVQLPQPPVIPPPPSLAHWNYVGYMGINGQVQGVVQNEETNSVEQRPVGGEFFGYKVESVDREQMVFVHGTTRVTLTIAKEDFPITPLDQGAAPQPTPPGGGRGGRGGP
jgi:hypothetical protein